MAFRFRQFNIADDRSSMKVGTDAVLLGAWAGSGSPASILDIGTGCGVIALMLAQRFPEAVVHAIDIHEASAHQAAENFNNSPWPDRLNAFHMSLQEYTGKGNKYDLVVSNPPFFTNALLPPDRDRTMARHTASLETHELFVAVKQLLNADGSFCVIAPYVNFPLMRKHAEENGLFPSKQCNIIPVAGKTANRALTEWRRATTENIITTLTIRQDPTTYTREYRELTEEFYLAL